MPQMMPLNWLTLFLLFIFIFLTFNIVNYFNFNYPNKSQKITKKKLTFNWKW